MNESKKLKTIAFDLGTKALEEHYIKGDWHNAYYDIEAFLRKNQFDRVQGSVYDSKIEMTDRGLGRLL